MEIDANEVLVAEVRRTQVGSDRVSIDGNNYRLLSSAAAYAPRLPAELGVTQDESRSWTTIAAL